MFRPVCTGCSLPLWLAVLLLGCGAKPIAKTADETAAYTLLKSARAASQTPETNGGLAEFVRIVETYPDTSAARTVLRHLSEAAIESGDTGHLTRIQKRMTRWAGLKSDLALEARWWVARIQLFGKGRIAAARRSLRRLVTDGVDHDRVDDALWLLGDIYRRQGAWERARKTYRALSLYRDTHGWAVGSERGRWADDAALMIADISLYVLDKPMAARRAYLAFVERFGDSVLVSEALLGLWLTEGLLGRKAKAKKTLAKLGRQELTRAQRRRFDAYKRIPWPRKTEASQILRALQTQIPARVFSTLGPRPTRLR